MVLIWVSGKQIHSAWYWIRDLLWLQSLPLCIWWWPAVPVGYLTGQLGRKAWCERGLKRRSKDSWNPLAQFGMHKHSWNLILFSCRRPAEVAHTLAQGSWRRRSRDGWRCCKTNCSPRPSGWATRGGTLWISWCLACCTNLQSTVVAGSHLPSKSCTNLSFEP